MKVTPQEIPQLKLDLAQVPKLSIDSTSNKEPLDDESPELSPARAFGADSTMDTPKSWDIQMDVNEEDFRSRIDKISTFEIPKERKGKIIIKCNKSAYGFSLKNIDIALLETDFPKDKIYTTLQQANKLCEITYAKNKALEFKDTSKFGVYAYWTQGLAVVFCLIGFLLTQSQIYVESLKKNSQVVEIGNLITFISILLPFLLMIVVWFRKPNNIGVEKKT
jgi:hypothetical protein